MRGEDIQLCEICGRYLYLPDPAEAEFLDHVEAAKPAAKRGGQAPEAPGAWRARCLKTCAAAGFEGTS